MTMTSTNQHDVAILPLMHPLRLVASFLFLGGNFVIGRALKAFRPSFYFFFFL